MIPRFLARSGRACAVGGGLSACAALVLGVLVSAPAARAAGGCEHITNAFAYNECLARQGPQRGQRAPSASSGEDPESTVRGRARGLSHVSEPEGGNGVVIQRRTGRRVSATIDPWAGQRGPSRRRR